MILLDTVDPLDRTEGFLFSASIVNGQQMADYFHLDSKTSITSLAWSGVANISAFSDEKADFVIRVFADENGQPATQPLREIIVSATGINATGHDLFGSSTTFMFHFDADEIFILEQGNYWLSVLDPGTNGLGFGWAIEKNKLSTFYGSGGALRGNENSPWQAMNEGVTPIQGRGYGLSIKGNVVESVPSQTTSYTMTFEGLISWEIIHEYYNGGYGIDYFNRNTVKSGPGPEYGVSFVGAYAAIDADNGGDGNFGNEPSSPTAMWCQQSGGWMNVPGGFTSLSFYYSNPNGPTKVYVYSGIDKTGTLLATIDLPTTEDSGAPDPTGSHSPFHKVLVSFSGVAKCFDFSEEANSGYIDDITILIPVENDESASSNSSEDTSSTTDSGSGGGGGCFIAVIGSVGNAMPLWPGLLCLAGALLADRRRQ